MPKGKKSTDVLILMSHVSCTSLYLCCIGHYLYQIKTSESERALLPSVFACACVLCTDEGLRSYLQMYSAGVCYVLFRWDMAWG